jgi:ABC-type branched-subunit amino acid transport system substrate-binding protein
MPVYEDANLAMVVPWTTAAVGGRTGVVSMAATSAETAKRLETLAQEQGFSRLVTISSSGVDPISVGTDAIVLDTDAVAGGEVVLGLREDEIELPILGQVDVGSPQLVQVAGQAASGLMYVSPGPDPAIADGTAAFVEAYQSMAGFPPGPRAILAYEATNILLDAVAQAFTEQGRQPGRVEVSAEMGKIERQGLSGDIRFDTRGQRVNAPIWIYQIPEEGRYPGKLVAAPEEQ